MRVFVLALFFTACVSHADSCRKADKGDSCRVEIADLHPTQFNVGEREVRIRASRFRKMKDKKLERYIDDNPAPVVLGPDREVYLIDRHHMARALNEAGVEKIAGVVLEDLSDLGPTQFWKKMIAKGWVLLSDKGVDGQSPSALPRKILDMSDDPYRSLAWSVNNRGGYQDTDIPYADFYWADFFRTRVDLSGRYSEAVNAALKLAHSSEARGLPGYSPNALSARSNWRSLPSQNF